MTLTPQLPGFRLYYNTPLAGQAFQNATPVFASITVPNDGQPHTVLAMYSIHVTVVQVGGGVSHTYSTPDGSNFVTTPTPGNLAVGQSRAVFASVCQPGSQFIVSQTAAQSSGTALLWLCLMVI